jgi:hypothetical protein
MANEKKEYYFKHDQNARHDLKIKAMINKYGVEGYGRYWIIVENLRSSFAYKIEDRPYNWHSLAEEMKCSVVQAKEFIQDCAFLFDLFVIEEGFFYSPSLLKRMTTLDETRMKRIEAGRLGGEARWSN